ncbi:MAG: RecQ family ATP-dependent DNA helicase, partial [Solirubrobacterales bacterium]|nr:RecQ family ATP-dependent DNA helicase [Solirubrobacterales bacterium]
FIEQAFPRRETVDAVLRVLDDAGADGASTPEIMAVVNLGRGRIDALLKVLDVEGAVSRMGTRWVLEPGSTWAYDAERYARITELRRHEQAAMAAFGADGRCLMRALQEELDDPDPADCGRCSACAGRAYGVALDATLVRDAALHLRSRPLVLEAKKMAPDAEGRMKKIPEDARAEDGRALARLGDGGWDPAIQAGLRAGRFDDELVDAAAAAIRSWGAPVAWVAAVPSTRKGDLVPDFARRLAGALGLPYADAVARTQERPPQREMANAAQQAANVRGAFAIADPPAGPCLLVDDVRFSGWTLAMVAGQLRRRGSGPVFPFALTSAF